MVYVSITNLPFTRQMFVGEVSWLMAPRREVCARHTISHPWPKIYYDGKLSMSVQLCMFIAEAGAVFTEFNSGRMLELLIVALVIWGD